MALLEDSLIAHYKMNENTAGDNAELVTNGDFAAWTADNPDGWTTGGESGADPEVSEVGTGEGHGGVGTGMCNLYTSDGTLIQIYQTLSLVVGRKYIVSILIDTVTAGGVTVSGLPVVKTYQTTGTKTFTFVATATSPNLTIKRYTGATDVTIDDVSIKLLAIEDSSGNDHDAIAQQDSDAISVAGKINTALEFNGSSDYIEIPDHADFSPILTPFSISAWINMDDATDFTIATKWEGSVREWRFRVLATDLLEFIVYDEIGNSFVGRDTSAVTSYENQWLHVVGTYDGGILSSGVKIYLNGAQADNADFEGGTFVTVRNSVKPVWIGLYKNAGSLYSNGTIDNVMFFNKELTPLEVQLLYNGGAGVETIPIGIHLSRTGQQFSSSPMN